MNESRRTIERILQAEPTRVSDAELDGIGERMLYKLHHSNPDEIIDDRGADGVRVPWLRRGDQGGRQVNRRGGRRSVLTQE